MHLLIITFGDNEQNHVQAHFCVYSFLAKKANFSSVNIFTDKPHFYKSLESEVKITALSEQLLKDWKGEFDYFWRIKVKAIEMLCERHPNEPVLYMDSDIVLYNCFEEAHKMIAEGNAGMHENEGVLQGLKPKSHRRMAIGLKNFKLGEVSDLPAKTMWNAGAILTPNTKNGEECKLALRLIDEMCRQNIQRYFIEQFSVSVAMAHFYKMQPLNSFLAHYWSNRSEWNRVMNKFFLENHLSGITLQQSIERFKDLKLENIPYKRIESNTKQRLTKKIANWFPDKNIEYLKIQDK